MKEMTLMAQLVPLLLALSLLGACGQNSTKDSDASAVVPAGTHELASETERLLIADGQASIVRVFDVAAGKVISNFPVGGPASVYTGASGRFGYAVQTTANQVSIVDSSMIFEDHGDHQHYDKYEPILLDKPLAGNHPIHFVVHDAFVAAFFDNDGEASILITRPELLPGASRGTPTGLAVHKANGEATGQVFEGCPVVHGEAALAEAAAFGCSDGVLLITASAGVFTSHKIPYASADTKSRVGTLIANENVPFFVGNFDSTHYAKIDAQTGGLDILAAPLEYAQFIFSKDGSRLLFLGKDGQLAVVETLTGKLLHMAPITAVATGIDYGARDAKIAAGKNSVYGAYVLPQYAVDSQWFLGLVLEYFSVTSLKDAIGQSIDNSTIGYVPTITYKASEFSTLRLAYDRSTYHREDQSDKTEQKVEIQANFLIGAHPAHDF